MDFTSILASIFPKIGQIYIPLLFALCVHEWAHGYAAKLCGDNTAERMGRLTLNPIPHIDPIGTVLMPLLAIFTGIPLFFGWAKPVPFDPRNLKNPRTGAFWIALAGPMSNIGLALVATAAIAVMVRLASANDTTMAFLKLMVSFIQVNLFLAIFNLIPVHPLDGGKVAARFLSPSANRWMEENEQIIGMCLMAAALMGALAFLSIPVMWATQFLLSLTGVQ